MANSRNTMLFSDDMCKTPVISASTSDWLTFLIDVPPQLNLLTPNTPVHFLTRTLLQTKISAENFNTDHTQTSEGADTNTSVNRVGPSVTDRNSVDQKTLPKLPTPSPLTPKTLQTPVKKDRLKAFLEAYNQQLVEYIVKGFKEGFSLCSNAKVNNIEPKSLKSAYLHPEILDDKIKK